MMIAEPQVSVKPETGNGQKNGPNGRPGPQKREKKVEKETDLCHNDTGMMRLKKRSKERC